MTLEIDYIERILRGKREGGSRRGFSSSVRAPSIDLQLESDVVRLREARLPSHQEELISTADLWAI